MLERKLKFRHTTSWSRHCTAAPLHNIYTSMTWRTCPHCQACKRAQGSGSHEKACAERKRQVERDAYLQKECRERTNTAGMFSIKSEIYLKNQTCLYSSNICAINWRQPWWRLFFNLVQWICWGYWTWITWWGFEHPWYFTILFYYYLRTNYLQIHCNQHLRRAPSPGLLLKLTILKLNIIQPADNHLACVLLMNIIENQ